MNSGGYAHDVLVQNKTTESNYIHSLSETKKKKDNKLICLGEDSMAFK